jgi:hypothetical protein
MQTGISTPYICRLEDYGCDEFCVVLKGSVTMIDDDGHEETFPAGDSFLIPKGFTGYWKQSEKIKKFFMTVFFRLGPDQLTRNKKPESNWGSTRSLSNMSNRVPIS